MVSEDSTELTYSLLLIDLVKEREKAEEQAKREQRAREQRVLAERLRVAAQQAQKDQGKKDPQAPQQTPFLPSLGPPPPPALTFLPGAPGADPIKEAAAFTQGAERYGAQLLAEGVALRDRTGSNNSPTQQERDAFIRRKNVWRDSLLYMKNWFKDRSREEAVSELARILDDQGTKLNQIAINLGE